MLSNHTTRTSSKTNNTDSRAALAIGARHGEGGVHAPWLDLLNPGYSSVQIRLQDEILAYVEYMAPTAEEQIVVASAEERVRKVVQNVFSRCQVHVFGSTETGLRLPGSDIDMVVETDDKGSTKAWLSRLSAILERTGWCERIHAIPQARVPIISFYTTASLGSVKFDVGINNMNGLQTGAFVKRCLESMPALRPLVLVIKKALSQHGLNDASKSGISSFAIICLCISFLQLNPYELSDEHLGDPMKTKSLGFILFDFLEYYSWGFPYKSMYVSVSQARLFPKKSANWIKQKEQGLLVVQCPCDPRRNITKTLSHKNLEKIKDLFSQAHDAIGRATVSSTNILGTLVFVDNKFIKYREDVRRLVQSGRFLRTQQSNTNESQLEGGFMNRTDQQEKGKNTPRKKKKKTDIATRIH